MTCKCQTDLLLHFSIVNKWHTPAMPYLATDIRLPSHIYYKGVRKSWLYQLYFANNFAKFTSYFSSSGGIPLPLPPPSTPLLPFPRVPPPPPPGFCCNFHAPKSALVQSEQRKLCVSGKLDIILEEISRLKPDYMEVDY